MGFILANYNRTIMDFLKDYGFEYDSDRLMWFMNCTYKNKKILIRIDNFGTELYIETADIITNDRSIYSMKIPNTTSERLRYQNFFQYISYVEDTVESKLSEWGINCSEITF